MALPETIPVVTEPTEAYLNPRQLVDYRAERETCLGWLLSFGKKPDEATGYAIGTVKPRSYRIDKFYRWVWQQEDGYTTNISVEHADGWMQELARSDASSTHKANCQKAIKMLFKWFEHERGGPKWEPAFTFSDSSGSNPRDYLTREERRMVRDASMEYGSVPDYSNVTPTERSRWERYLAQRFEKPTTDVTKADWDRANSWKMPSLVWSSLDAGLRPVEVERATVDWFDAENEILRIPKQDSAKSRDNWTVSILSKTAEYLDRWITERKRYDLYTERQHIWLTREGNPYTSQSLLYVLHRLCEIADIDITHRKMSWYEVRDKSSTQTILQNSL